MTTRKSLNDCTDILSDGGTGIEEEQTMLSTEIAEPYDPSELRVDTRIVSLDALIFRIKHSEIDLNPEFQRKGGIWKEHIQSRLIESLIISIPIPAFYFDATDEGKWLVVDGLQRLFALKRFIIDEDLSLTGLEFLTDQNSRKFSELPRKFQRRILETQLTLYLIQEGTPEEAKFNIFKRINTGGLPLSSQEIRHALNQGNATKLLKKLSKTGEFLKATDRCIKDERMGDRECILRFLAFTITSYNDYKVKDFDGFLNSCMALLNKMESPQLTDLEKQFLKVMRLSHDIFGTCAFRKIAKKNGGFQRQAINKALFEVWSVNLNVLKSDERDILRKKKEQVIDLFAELLQDPEFSDAISSGTGEVNKVKTRFKKVESLIRRVLSCSKPCQ